MEVKILAFGHLADITGKREWDMQDVPDATTLKEKIEKEFPGIAGIQYRLAVNKKICSENVVFKGETTVALLPPFSGG